MFIVDYFSVFFLSGQSQDASCDGLITPQEGARTFEIYLPPDGATRSSPSPGCTFPPELTDRHRLSTLDSSELYEFSSNRTISIRNARNKHQTRASFLCHQRNTPPAAQQQKLGPHAEYVIHSKSGW